MKIIYFGTPLFAASVLNYLLKNGIEVLAIVTKPDKPKGRSGKPIFTDVKQYARENHQDIPVFQPDRASSPSFIKELELFGPDLFVVVAYGEIISQDLLDLPRLGCINLHASLLPKYRGAAPIQYALLDGLSKTGVTVIEMSLKMDAGDILEQEEILVTEEMNFEELEDKLCKIGSKALYKVIQKYEKNSIKKIPQNHSKASYVQKITSEMTQINWNNDARVIHNQVRAFNPYPGAWCNLELGGSLKRLKIFKTKIIKKNGLKGKTLSYSSAGWEIACGSGVIFILELQLEGKKRLSFSDFYKGFPQPPKIR